jgi:hypothetical protein
VSPRALPVTTVVVLASSLSLLAGCGSSSSQSQSSAQSNSTASSQTAASQGTTLGYEGVPLEQGPELAPASSTTQGATVDGIQCGATEQLAYHIHAHLAVYVNGQPRSLPAGIGIPGAVVQQSPQGPVVGQGKCFYWLHTHTTDGVVHIESPSSRIYTLGNLFDEWRQPLSTNQVGPNMGKVSAFLNGQPWTKDPRSIPLEPHAVIQLDVGTPVAPYQPLSFAGTQL